MSTPTPPKNYVLLKKGDLIKEGDLMWWAGSGWEPANIAGDRVNLATFCRKARRTQRRKVTSKSPQASHTTFTVPIYNCEVTLAVTKDLRDVPFEITEEDRETYTNEDEANAFHIGRRLLVAFKPGCLSHDTITHELFHVTHYILQRANVRLTKKSDEAHAYLAGFLAGETYKALKKITKERIK